MIGLLLSVLTGIGGLCLVYDIVQTTRELRRLRDNARRSL